MIAVVKDRRDCVGILLTAKASRSRVGESVQGLIGRDVKNSEGVKRSFTRRKRHETSKYDLVGGSNPGRGGYETMLNKTSNRAEAPRSRSSKSRRNAVDVSPISKSQDPDRRRIREYNAPT